jgi:hypothetical protein
MPRLLPIHATPLPVSTGCPFPLQRHFNLVSVVDFDGPTLSRIFGSLLEWHLDTKAFPAYAKVGEAGARDVVCGDA